ncbi:MAG: Trk system potassium transporter TrkA [Clostridiales bacterium]|jgi:trk system potassium uptake protein TrkA|nr:Trk system potassium transporter TrkA [Clostridiales bacterium]
MRIVIVGCGKVGSALVEQLSAEGHDIVVIDSDKETVDGMANMYDVIGIYGNGASHPVQEEAEVSKADLLIATTSFDELNMLCCLSAKKMGAGNTIARIRNPEYFAQLDFLREELGLSMHINPEYATAGEIFRTLRFTSAQKIETFANGMIEIAEIRVTEDSVMSGLRLKDFGKVFDVKALVCAVQRVDSIFIPDGNFVLESGDKISLVAAPDQAEKIFEKIGHVRKKLRNVFIIGGSRIGFYLAQMLLSTGAGVKIIDNDDKRARYISEELPKATVILGDGTDQELLHEEGIGNADALVALTGVDEENVIISMYANYMKVEKVVAKVNRSGMLSLLDNIGLDNIVSPKLITANMIIQYVRAMKNTLGSNVETLYKIARGKAEALEFIARQASDVIGVPLKKLKTRKNLLIAGIIRGNQAIIPNGEDRILMGDRVVVVTTNTRLDDLSDILA